MLEAVSMSMQLKAQNWGFCGYFATVIYVTLWSCYCRGWCLGSIAVCTSRYIRFGGLKSLQVHAVLLLRRPTLPSLPPWEPQIPCVIAEVRAIFISKWNLSPDGQHREDLMCVRDRWFIFLNAVDVFVFRNLVCVLQLQLYSGVFASILCTDVYFSVMSVEWSAYDCDT